MAAIDSHLAMEQRAAGDCHPTLCGDDCEDDNHGDHTGHDEFCCQGYIKFSKYWGYGGLYVINLCSDISTCPKETINKLKTNEEIDSTV